MHRLLLLVLGLVELGVALTLVHLGRELPARSELEQSFQTAGEVTGRAEDQIRQVRDQVRLLRQPQFQDLALQLQRQLRVLTRTLREKKVDFDTLAALRDGLDGVAEGLDGAATTFEPDGLNKLGNGLGQTADFLDQKLIPTAEAAAANLDKSTTVLADSARKTAQLLRELPLDFKALRAMHDGLGRFGDGLDRMSAAVQLKRLQKMREGLQGLNSALTVGADQVERLSRYSYPVVRFEGLKPLVQQRAFWPDGDRAAEGLRKAARGVLAADQELADVMKQIPELKSSLEASRKVVTAARSALALAMKQQPLIEPLLKDLPVQAAQMAESLPRVGQDLARMLRETRRLKEVSTALRQVQAGLDKTARNWPELRKTVQVSAKLLRATSRQLDQALQQREEYEKAIDQTATLGETFATMLPLFSQQMVQRLEDQEHSLDNLSRSLGEVRGVLPEYGQSAGRIADTARWLVWLVAAAVALHGAHILLGLRSHGTLSGRRS
jgi:hypothetical protein